MLAHEQRDRETLGPSPTDPSTSIHEEGAHVLALTPAGLARLRRQLFRLRSLPFELVTVFLVDHRPLLTLSRSDISGARQTGVRPRFKSASNRL